MRIQLEALHEWVRPDAFQVGPSVVTLLVIVGSAKYYPYSRWPVYVVLSGVPGMCRQNYCTETVRT